VTDANVSGREVPIATKVIAVIAGLSPTTQPSSSATVPTTAVIPPISASATMKAGKPPAHLTGGMTENISFQPMSPKWKSASPSDTLATIKSSSSI